MTATSGKSEILKNRLVELARDLILIPSTRDRLDEIERCMEFVVNHAESDAVEVRRFKEEGSPSAVVLPAGVERPEVMLLAHLDVVARPEGT
ncbi:MAG TPA: M20 family peptidase, partial [Candidatus Binatia bacterium]